jgi:hypothetical protein
MSEVAPDFGYPPWVKRAPSSEGLMTITVGRRRVITLLRGGAAALPIARPDDAAQN